MKVIGWDTETFLVEQGNLTPTLVCLSLAGGEDTLCVAQRLTGAFQQRALVRTHPGGWSALVSRQDALEGLLLALHGSDLLVGHHAAFDWVVMARRYPGLVPVMFAAYQEGRVSCTRTRELLAATENVWMEYDPRIRVKDPGYSLAQCAQARLGIDISADKKGEDTWRLRYAELFDTALQQWPQEASRYAMDDAVLTRELYFAQGEGPVVDELPQVRAALCLQLIAAYGVRTDPEAVAKFSAMVNERAAMADKHAATHGWLRVNRCKSCAGTGRVGTVPELHPCPACQGLDDMDCRARGLYKSKAAPLKPTKDMGRLREWVTWAFNGRPPLTDTGQVSVDAETLSTSRQPVLTEYEELLGYIKLRDTYLPILQLGLSKALTSSPNVLRETGRTSWRGPNMQNPPRAPGYRDCFVPRPGMVFASVDYTGEELVCLAFACLTFFGHSRLAEVINAGQDVHLWLAAKLLRVSYETAEAWIKGTDKELKARAKAARQLAKVGNFGIPGGMGARALCDYATNYGVVITLNEAYDLIRAFKDAFPEVREYFEMNANAVDNGPVTATALVSGRRRGGCSYTVLCNTFFQSLAADLAKCAMWRLTVACYADTESPLFGCRVWNFIHDEFLVEGPEETAHIWAPEVSRIMVEAATEYTPQVRQAAPPALMRRWLKDAEPKYDDTGKLIPWEA